METVIQREARTAVEKGAQELPELTGGDSYEGITLHLVDLAGSNVLLALGHVPVKEMIPAAWACGKDYTPEDYATLPDVEDAETVLQLLEDCRVSYRRVEFTITEDGWELDWLKGNTPVTVWVL